MVAHLHRLGAMVLVTLGIAVAVVGTILLGAAVPSHPGLALAVSGAVLLLGVTAVQPAALPLLAMAALLVNQRVDVGFIDLTASDLMLFVAVWPALLVARRGYSREMRSVVWFIVIYQLATLFTVVANPYLDNAIDWVHSGMLAGGALIVGWAVGREGLARLGLGLVLGAGAVLASSTVVQGIGQVLTGDLAAVYTQWPFPMHKNFVGTTLGAIAVIGYVHPAWMGWSRRAALGLFWLCALAILFSQSRQALVALGVTLVFIVLRRDPDRSRSKLILTILPPAIALVALTVKTQAESSNTFNSVSQRLTWFEDSIDVWSTSPVFGVGLRYWYTDRFSEAFQPPNVLLEVLTTAGVVGVAGFVVMMIGTLITLGRVDPRYGTLGIAVLLNRLVQGQFDIFWVSVGVSLPFLVAGVCMGAQAHDAENERPQTLPRNAAHAEVPT